MARSLKTDAEFGGHNHNADQQQQDIMKKGV
jgi:hypothetical protein